MRAALGLRQIALELEEFNRRFVVESEDERFAIACLEQRMMEALLALPESVTVDVNEDVVLLSAPELLAEQVPRLYDAAVAIHRRIPRDGGGRWTGGFFRQILRAPLLSAVTTQRLRLVVSKETGQDLRALAELIERGDVTPVVGRTFLLIEAADAIRHLEGGHATGKVGVTV